MPFTTAVEPRQRAWRFNSCVAVWLVACTSLGAAGCAGDECQRGETQCDNGVAKECLESEGLFENTRRWGGDQDCGAPSLCVLTPAGSIDYLAGKPFCVLDPQPDPSCVLIESAALASFPNPSATCSLDGLSLLSCRDGYVVGRRACASCTKLSADQLECSGSFSSPCQRDADCRSSLLCNLSGSTGFCSRPCSCDPREGSCVDCVNASGDESVGQRDTAVACREGWCSL
jgi:hypothetical protein